MAQTLFIIAGAHHPGGNVSPACPVMDNKIIRIEKFRALNNSQRPIPRPGHKLGVMQRFQIACSYDLFPDFPPNLHMIR